MAILDGVYDDLVLAADRWYCVDELDIIGTFYQSASLWGSASDTFVASGGVLKVSSGGVVNQTTILYIGYMEVGSDGLANQTTVSSHGSMVVHKGGTANETTIMSGAVEVSSGGTANKATVNGGHIRMHDSGTANSVTVNKGLASVGVGGTLNVAVVNSGGYMFVGERVHSYAPGKATATSITVNDGGILRVFESGVANSITLASGATLHVSMGGMAECTLASGATLHVSSGGTAAFTITSGASVYISSGGTILRYIMNEEETWSVSEGVVAIETTVNSWGNMYVSSGGTANQTTVSGGKATMVVKPDGVANTTTVADGGLMYVSSGGTANDTTVNSDGIMRLQSSGTANETTVSDGGRVYVSSGATANKTTVIDGGRVIVSLGVANETTVNSGGTMLVRSGVANDTTVNSGGTMFVSSGGIASNTTLNGGATLAATGPLTLAEGAVFSAYDGAVIDFDISKLSPGNEAIVNDLSLVQGTPTYTVTVSATQTEGDYVLAEGAANFTGTMTVKCANAEDASVTVGGASAASGGKYYSLAVENGKLLFTVSADSSDTVPPVAPEVSASTTDPTNQNVTVTATFSDDSAQRQYSLDGMNWNDYTEPIVFSDNGTVFFRGIDDAGNISDVKSYAVTNIDKVAPEQPTAVADITDPTNQNVTVTATFSDDSAQRQYALDGMDWSDYTEPIVFSDNGTVWFRGIDDAENFSEVTSYEVTNIDKVAPVITLLFQNSTLTAATEDGVAIYYNTVSAEYTGDWTEYTGGLTNLGNSTCFFMATDAAGNVGTATFTPDNAVDGVVTNSTAGEEGSFDEAATTDDWTQVLFSTGNTTYNYTDGLVATHAMEISGNGTSATTLSGGALYLDGNEASFSDLAFDGLLFGVKSAESGELEADGASLSFNGAVFTDSARVFGGADLSGTVAANLGDITIVMEEVDGGQARIFGAGRVAGGASLIVGNIDVSISCADGGSFSNFFAGAEARSGFTGSIICEDIYSTIESGTFTYCGNGSQLRGEGTSIQNDSTLFIKDGTFNYFVYAGAFSAGGMALVDGSTTLVIRGGTFNSHVFGGCGANNSNNGAYTRVNGDTSVMIDTMEKEVSFNGNIYAGSIGAGTVSGSTTMTFTGDGANLSFNANSYVTGGSQLSKNVPEYIGGTATLAFDGFSGDFSANVNNGFTKVAISDSNVSFTASKVALNAVSSWTIEVGSADAELTLLKGKNNFKGDSLKLTLADDAAPDARGWDVVAGTAATLSGWDSFSQVTICGEAAAYADGTWSSSRYRLYREDNVLKLASIA